MSLKEMVQALYNKEIGDADQVVFTGYTKITPSSPYTVTKTGTIFVLAGYCSNSGTSGRAGYADLSGCTLVSPVTVASNSSRLDGSTKFGVAKEGDVVTFGCYANSASDWRSSGWVCYEPV